MGRGTKLLAIAALGLVVATGLGGCATTGTAGLGLKVGSGTDAAMKHAVPTEVSVAYEDGSPAAARWLRAVDSSEHVYDVHTNEAGADTVPIWSEAIVLWRVESGGEWRPIPPCRPWPANGKKKWIRFACTIERGGSK